MIPLRILLAGEGRSPIHEAAWQTGLEAAGCRVQRFNWIDRFSSSSSFLSFFLRAQNQLLTGPVLDSLNKDLLLRTLISRPDVLLLYRPTHIYASTLAAIRQQSPNTLIVSYNNDDPFSPKSPPHLWRHYIESIPHVDVSLAYREKNLRELSEAGAPKVEMLRSYFLPDIHHPVQLSQEDHAKFASDVAFVGHFEPDGRLDYLAAIAEKYPGFRLFGPDWERAPRHPSLRRLYPIHQLKPSDYVKAIQSTKIALVFLSGLNNDTYTRRVFEIPAIGSFMLSQRTKDLENLFTPGEEAEFFNSPEEAISKIDHYLQDTEGRIRVAKSGARKVRDAGHDVFSRMSNLVGLLRSWRNELISNR